MIRAAIAVGTLSILAALGLLAYRHWDVIQRSAGLEDACEEGAAPALPGTPAKAEQPPATPVPAPAPKPAPAPVTNPPPDRPAPGYRTHRVREGDSLWVISRSYYGSPDQIQRLADANGMASSNRLRVGQILIVPDIKGVPYTPPDADHETTALPERAPPAENNPAPAGIPPTLSRTVPKE